MTDGAVLEKLEALERRLRALERFLPVLQEVHAGSIAPDGSLSDILEHGENVPQREFSGADFPGLQNG